MASLPSPRDPLLDHRLQAVLTQRGLEVLGMVLVTLGLLLALILGSYAPQDPGWMAATDEPVRNALGRVGAAVAAPLVIITGKAGWGLSLALVVWGLRLIVHIGEGAILARTIFVPIAVALTTVWLATLVPAADWGHDFGLGGMFGDTVLGALLTALPISSTFGFNFLTLLAFFTMCVMWAYVLGSSLREVLAIGAFLVAGLILTYAAVAAVLGRGLRSGGRSLALGLGGALVRAQDGIEARRAARAAAQMARLAPAAQIPGGFAQPGFAHPLAPQPGFLRPLLPEGQWAGLPPEPAPHAAPARTGRVVRAEPGLTRPAAPNAAPTAHATAPMTAPSALRAAPPAPANPFALPTASDSATGWGQPGASGLLSMVAALGRRPEAPVTAAGSPAPAPAPRPEPDRLRDRIGDLLRNRSPHKPVLRIPPAEAAPIPGLRPEPALTAPPAQLATPAAPAAGLFGLSHSFGWTAQPVLAPPLPAAPMPAAPMPASAVPAAPLPAATPVRRVIAPVDAGEDDDLIDDSFDPTEDDEALAALAPPQSDPYAQPRQGGVYTRRVVQPPARKVPPPSSRARAEAQPTLPFEARRPSYEPPPLSLLADPSRLERYTLSDEALEENARMLESVLDDYGVRGEIIAVRPGPVVTLYELEPAPGVKASRVIGLSDDIARSMSALSARIATVPGRSVIGIELPNAKREKVLLREIIGTRDFGDSNLRLPLALGKEIGGEPVVANLAKMPHLLIAGTTGSGKSVAINTMILSLLYKLTPAECRLIMIDPKMLELSVYDGIPHLLSPVVTDPKKAVVALKWVVGEMEERYRRMSKMNVRNIDGYNGRVREALARGEMFKRTIQTGFDDETGDPVFETEEFAPEALPYIVVVVDEMADLMMTAGKEIEACIMRLAQMARASGIHIIMATQRPSVDVITGIIKANFPTRISFQVTSKIDSRTILGEQGAEQLLGMGDMLYMAGGSRISRVHGPFVSDEEVEEVVRHLKSFGPPAYETGVLEEPEAEAEGDAIAALAEGAGDEALYDQAVAIVARDRKCSTSYIQRKLGIGYNKAARLVEQMEDQGVVTRANAVGKRDILVPEA
jgi:DNA segregation ATPase FtsK/SpoIIIE, S-DNA-T family